MCLDVFVLFGGNVFSTLSLSVTYSPSLSLSLIDYLFLPQGDAGEPGYHGIDGQKVSPTSSTVTLTK